MSNSVQYHILPFGDCAVSVDFGSVIAPETNALVQALRLKMRKINGISEMIPTFRA